MKLLNYFSIWMPYVEQKELQLSNWEEKNIGKKMLLFFSCLTLNTSENPSNSVIKTCLEASHFSVHFLLRLWPQVTVVASLEYRNFWLPFSASMPHLFSTYS